MSGPSLASPSARRAGRLVAATACLAAIALLPLGHAGTASASTEGDADARPEVVLWHAYRATEAEALERFIQELNASETAFRVKVLKVPYDAYLDKITAAIPRGKGPDLFIAAHDTVGDWAEARTIQPVGDVLDTQMASTLLDGLVPPLVYKGETYGIPLAFKSLALWRNVDLAPEAPKTLAELVEKATAATTDGTYGLVYENRLLYFHAPLLYGFGGRLFDEEGRPSLAEPGVVASVRCAMALSRDQKIVPQEVNGAVVTGLFNQGKAAFIFAGPWSLGEIEREKVRYAVSPFPVVDEATAKQYGGTAGPMRPFLGVEAVMISGRTEKLELAKEVARRLAGARSSEMRLLVGQQAVARKDAWEALSRRSAGAGDLPAPDQALADALRAFRDQLKTAVATPNTPAMKAMWSPTDLALGESMGQGTDPAETLKGTAQKLEGVMSTAMEGCTERDHKSFSLFLIVVVFGLLGWFTFYVKRYGAGRFAGDVKRSWMAYLYLLPTAIGLGVLVFVPFFFGVGLGFYRHTWGDWCFIGLENYARILAGSDSRFFYTLGMTILWTASNVFLHVTIGVLLALLLSQARLKMRGVYRVLFIVPWAVPNYITALIWKGMFHPEFGAINAVLGLEGFSWMGQTWSAFLANLATNTWLGFPFMMVTALGGLTAIPKDLYEAADLDGAGPLTKFFRITLPLLRPVLAPAIVLGTVWTFNMFNIIYLVSGGAPGGSTDILITEAFRWAFERGQGGAFGYAAAYSTMIFLMLLGYTVASNRVSRAVQGSRP